MSKLFKGHDVIILSSTNYYRKSKSKLNAHIIAEEIAKKGNKVLFVESLGLKDIHIFGISDIEKSFQRVFYLIKQLFVGLNKPQENLHILSLFRIPFDKFEIVNKLNRAILTRSIKKYSKKYLDAKPLIWSFVPNLWYIPKAIKNSGFIYQNIDDYSAIPFVDKSYIVKSERKTLKVADIVFTVSPKRIPEFKEYTNSDVIYLNNVCNFELFNQAQKKGIKPPIPLKKIIDLKKPIVGYIGNLAAYKEDINLLTKIAQMTPEYSFVLIGGVGDGEMLTNILKLRTLHNVYFLGPKDYDQLHQYIKYFDVAIITRRLNAAGEGGFPMKYFEFLAAGKPTIVTGIGSLKAYSKLARLGGIGTNEKTFVKLIKYWIELKDKDKKEYDKAVKERIKLAKLNSWDKRMVQLNRFITRIIH